MLSILKLVKCPGCVSGTLSTPQIPRGSASCHPPDSAHGSQQVFRTRHTSLRFGDSVSIFNKHIAQFLKSGETTLVSCFSASRKQRAEHGAGGGKQGWRESGSSRAVRDSTRRIALPKPTSSPEPPREPPSSRLEQPRIPLFHRVLSYF